MWEVEYTNEFEMWWDKCDENVQQDIKSTVGLLEHLGPNLKYPYSSGITSSKFNHMRELRIQHNGEPYRILYAFDPKRVAILLIGGCKTGNNRWYEKYIPMADKLYEIYLMETSEEPING